MNYLDMLKICINVTFNIYKMKFYKFRDENRGYFNLLIVLEYTFIYYYIIF